MLFDALAEAYDHIVIARANQAVVELIATIEGNIDAGVVAGGEEGFQHDGSSLGFDAAQLRLIRYAPTRPASAPSQWSRRRRPEANSPRRWRRGRTVRLSRRSTTLLKGLLSALHYSGADRLLALTPWDRSGRQPVPADRGSERRWRTTNVAEKDAAFYAIYWWLRSIKEELRAGEAYAVGSA
jgi:hypothetical protein